MIKIKPTTTQIKKVKEIFDVTRYIYNKVNSEIKKNIHLYKKKQLLRDKYVTVKTKKLNEFYEENRRMKNENTENAKLAFSENEHLLFKNIKQELLSAIKKETNCEIRDFELGVSKSIRDNTIRNLCANYESAATNLKNGNIKFFDIKYKKKTAPIQCFKLAKNDIKMRDGAIRINPEKFGEAHCSFKIGKRNFKKYGACIIENGCDFIKNQSGYYIGLVLPTINQDNKKFENFCGVDPGVRTLLTCYGSNGVVEYNHNIKALDKLNYLIRVLKTKRKKRTKKKNLSKLDKKKKNYIDDIHWKSITHLLKTNDVIFFGDIKSHGIVKNGKNKTLNRNFNDLKFYLFKQRLEYKALLLNKKLEMVHEAYTTQGCSCCGNLWRTIGSEKVYKCSKCKSTFDRDVNSAKNILMKGLLKK
jgi:putative transposase